MYNADKGREEERPWERGCDRRLAVMGGLQTRKVAATLTAMIPQWEVVKPFWYKI